MRRLLKQAKKHRLVIPLIITVIIALVFWLWPDHTKTAAPYPTTTVSPSTSPKLKSPTPGNEPIIKTQPQAFNKKLYSTDQASSLWVVVNKGRILPVTYVPGNSTVSGLRQDTWQAWQQLLAAAQAAGVHLSIISGYRSYTSQQAVYSNYVKLYGQIQADTFSARPGHSEHQTGLAIDVQPASGKCSLDQCFGGLSEGKWLAANAYKYGFIIRYPVNAEAKTGYEYEPWHIRYVGDALANELHRTGQTLEEFFSLPIYQSYQSNNYQLH